MLKRLIIAVFGIALVLAFGSTALAGPTNPANPAADIGVDHMIPNHPRLNQVDNARPQPPATRPNAADHSRKLPSGTNMPGPASLIYFCDAQDYSGGPYFAWVLPDPDIDLFNTRFTVEPGFNCTLKVAHVALYEGFFTGSPGMRVYLWADDGFGLPGALLDSVDVSNATILSYTLGSLAYVPADFSAAGWVFSDGDSYHYGVTVLGGVGDTLCITSDDGFGPNAGDERSSAYYSGAFYSNLDLFGGPEDYVWDIVSERCCDEIPFSDCYSQYYATSVNFFWRVPHQTYGDEEFAMRFDVGGPETLSSVDFFVYNAGGTIDPAGNNEIYVKIYDDDGSGLPGTLLTSATLLPGSYPFFPAYTNVPFAPLVLENAFHVAIRTNGTWDGLAGTAVGDTWEAILSDDGTSAAGRSSSYWVGGPWVDMLSGWGVDYSFHIGVNMCRDEFSDCQIQNWLGPFFDANYPIPEEAGNGTTSWAQKFTNAPSGDDCELRQLTVHLARNGLDVGLRPLMYTHNTLIHVATDVGGDPGVILHTEVLTPADYAAAGYTGDPFVGNLYFTRNVNVAIPATFWVIVESLSPTRAEGIRLSMNLTGGGGFFDGSSLYYTGIIYGPPAEWLLSGLEFFAGVSTDYASDIAAKVCCVPFSGRVCAPAGDDWSSRSHDFGRSGASQLAIGDAWCDLNLGWFQDDLNAAASAQTMGPIIYEGRAFQILETAAAGSSIRVFNLATGASEGTISGAQLGNFAENDPIIVNDKLYVAGGDNRIVSRWDVSGVIPGAPDWQRTLGAAGGPLRRTNLILLNVAGTDVLFGGTQIGRAFAINESDGLDYPGWATNPITMDAGQLASGSGTNGTELYFSTRQGGLNGDVWAINPPQALLTGNSPPPADTRARSYMRQKSRVLKDSRSFLLKAAWFMWLVFPKATSRLMDFSIVWMPLLAPF